MVRPQVLQNPNWTRRQHRKYKSPGGLVFLLGILAKAVTGQEPTSFTSSTQKLKGVEFVSTTF